MPATRSTKTPPPSARSKVRRHAGRGRYDRTTIDAILDEGMVGHVGLQSDGQPFVIPVLYGRSSEELFLHGSPLSRLLGTAAAGAPLCFTVTLLDGLVLARSAFHHSMNYRSVVVFGQARVVDDREEKLEALRLIVEHVVPGRSADVRGPSDQELKATEVLALGLNEASAKVRTGPPLDAAADMQLPAWAGELPLTIAPGAPIADTATIAPVPPYIRLYQRPGAFHEPDAA
jgi:nitroimidazol reductase NimA-like FMN-containing flavoprotein (pyridoxamine 5'-phosphate oxidase superfamily)